MNSLEGASPAWQVSEWLNSDEPVTLASLRGRVVVLHAFQMLCPGCVSDGLPQAVRIHKLFPRERVAVIGLHTVFEHHDVMGPTALRVFLSEYRIRFPVGVDQQANDCAIPLTMRAYGLQGTPSIVVFDQEGRVRLSRLGPIADLDLGAVIGELQAAAASDRRSEVRTPSGAVARGASRSGEVCAVDVVP